MAMWEVCLPGRCHADNRGTLGGGNASADCGRAHLVPAVQCAHIPPRGSVRSSCHGSGGAPYQRSERESSPPPPARRAAVRARRRADRRCLTGRCRSVLDLEKLDGPTAIEMMEDGKLTSVQLTGLHRADRRAEQARSRPERGHAAQPGRAEGRRAAGQGARRGHVRGPAHGLPILLKDLIDVKGMYTSAGNYSLRDSFPENDSGIVKKLRASGVVILGKLGLSEYANSFGNQPSGFSQPDRPGAQRARRRPEPERLVVGLRRGGRRGAVDADGRHRDLGLDHQPVGRAEPGRHPADRRARARLRHRARSRRRRTPPARWTARSPTRRCTCSRSPGATRRATPGTTAIFGPEHRTPSSRRCRRRCPTTCRRST